MTRKIARNDRECVRNYITTVIPECIYRESRPIFYKYYKKRISLQTKIQTHSLRETGKGGRPLRNKIQICYLRETVGGVYNSKVQYFRTSPEKSPYLIFLSLFFYSHLDLIHTKKQKEEILRSLRRHFLRNTGQRVSRFVAGKMLHIFFVILSVSKESPHLIFSSL